MDAKKEEQQEKYSSIVHLQVQPEDSHLSDTLKKLPSYVTRGLLYLMGLFLIIALFWAAMNRIDVTVTTHAVIIPEDKVKVIQADIPGIVERITVGEGENVNKGQILAVIESEEVSKSLFDLKVTAMALSDAQEELLEIIPLEEKQLQTHIDILNEKLNHLLPKREVFLNKKLIDLQELIPLKEERLQTQINLLNDKLSSLLQQQKIIKEKILTEKQDFDLKKKIHEISLTKQNELLKRLELELKNAQSILSLWNEELEIHRTLSEEELVSRMDLLKAEREHEEASLRVAQNESLLREAAKEREIMAKNFVLTSNQNEKTLRDLEEQSELINLEVKSVQSEIQQKKIELEMMKLEDETTLKDLQERVEQVKFEVVSTQAEMMQKKNDLVLLKIEAERKLERAVFQHRQLNELTTLNLRGVEPGTLENIVKGEITNLTIITAPAHGIISKILVRNKGEAVARGQTIMSLVPQGVELVAELSIPNKDIGLIKTGQKTKLKFDAFPYMEYGAITGELISILPDAEINPQMGSYYRVISSLNQDYFRAKGEKISLLSGMTASAEIVTEQKTILTLIIKPFTQLKKTTEAEK